MRATKMMSNIRTVDGDENKNTLYVPKSRRFKPMVQLKSSLQGFDTQGDQIQEARQQLLERPVNKARGRKTSKLGKKTNIDQRALDDGSLKKRNIRFSRNALKNIPETMPKAISIKLIEEE